MATVKKRRLEEDAELSRIGDGPVGPQLPPHLREQPADPQAQHIAQLEGKLKHLRGWMKAIQDQMQANIVHRDTVFNARRLFVGGVPPGTSDDELCRFLGDAIINTGASVSSTGRPVTYCRIQRDKNFAFVEVRSAEEASNCMALDGLVFKDAPLKIKRPSKYDQAASFALGPTDPDPSMDLSQVIISTPPAALATVSDLPPGKYEATNNTLYVGGLPIEWTNEQCMELLKMYGEVKYFRLMIDRQTGNSRGFAFAEYTTDESTNAALAALDGAQLGPRRIAANRMLEHKQKQQQQQQMQQQGMWQGQGQVGGGGGNMGGWGGRQDGFGGSGGRGPGMGGTGMQQGPAGGMGGMMGQQGGMMPPTPMPGAGMQQQGGYGYDGMGGGYGMGAQMQQQQQMPQQQQGLANQLAVGGGMGMGAMGGMPAAAAGGGMQGMGPSQQGMYGMNQPAAGAGGGYDASYGGQMQSGGGMYGGQQQQQPGMGLGAAGMPMGGMGAADGYGQQYGMAGGYGQQYDQQQQMQQPGYGAAAGGMGGAPPMGAGGGGMGGAGAMGGPGGQMGGMQGPAGGMGGIQQPVPPPRRADQAPLTIKTEQPASGPLSTGIAGAMGGWQGQPQAAWSGTSGQQMQNWA